MAAAEPELCPHCGRPFKRLRAHLPHCKAAKATPSPPATATPSPPATAPATATPSPPATAPGTARGPRPSASAGPRSGARPAPASAPIPQPSGGSVPGPSAAPAVGTGAGTGTGAGRGASRAVRAVARSMDLHPEEVHGVPGMLQRGLTVVIEKHRARVLREKGAPGKRRQRPEPGPAPQSPKTIPKSAGKEARSRAAAGSGAAASKSSSKAAEALQEPPESRSGRGDPGRPQGRDKCAAGEERARPASGLGAGGEPPERALQPSNPQLALPAGMLARDSARKELGVPEPPGKAPAPLQTRPAGLEWFPALYPHYEGLRIFPGKRLQQDVRIAEAPGGGLAQGQQGPLSEVLEVRLGELHTWISTCSFSPQGLLGAVQRAWSSYCAKYIHVKQGGPAGISMLLAGSCLLSYGWNYQHLKRHRWRKYH